MVIFIRALKRWWNADPATHGAALAYYAIFSIAPLFIIFVTILGSVFGRQAVEGKLMDALQGFAGAHTSELIQTLVTYVTASASSTLVAVVSAIFVILGALALFDQAQRALEDLWHTPHIQPTPFIRTKILAIGMISVLGILIVISFFLNALMPIIELHALISLLNSINGIVSLVYVVVIFALMYKYLPGQSVSWKAAFLGGFIGGLLFFVGRYFLNLYFTSAFISSLYGTTGAVILILVWFYYMAQLFFFGGAITYVVDND